MIWHSKLLLIILLIIALVTVGYFYKQWLKEKKIDADYEAIAKRVADLQKENKMLEDKIAKLENEEELERLARELYALKKPDENVVVIPQDIMQKITAENNSSSTNNKTSFQWWEKIKLFFYDLF